MRRFRETSAAERWHRGTDSTAEARQTALPSEELKTNSAADNSTQDVFANHTAADLRQRG